MSLVKVIGNQSVCYDGDYYTPEDGTFEMDDKIAFACQKKGLVEPIFDEVPATSTEEVHEVEDEDDDGLYSLDSMTDNLYEVLVEAGFDTVEKIAETNEEDLVALKGIGKTIAGRLIEEATAEVG